MNRMSEDMCPSVYTNFPINNTTDAHALDSAVITGYLEATSRIEVPTVEVIPKDQYEARLKADLKAILVELQLEIEESMLKIYDGIFEHEYNNAFNEGLSKGHGLIQDKINALKGDTE